MLRYKITKVMQFIRCMDSVCTYLHFSQQDFRVSQAQTEFVCSQRYLILNTILTTKGKEAPTSFALEDTGIYFHFLFMFFLRTVSWRNPVNNLVSFSVTAFAVILSKGTQASAVVGATTVLTNTNFSTDNLSAKLLLQINLLLKSPFDFRD